MNREAKNTSCDNEQDPTWIDSENLEHIRENSKDKKRVDDDIRSIDSGKDAIPLQERINSNLYIVRETGSGQLLWKCSINQTDALANHIVAADKLLHRLPCHSFRSMLSAQERPPTRSPSWLRSCVMGILTSALKNYNSEEGARQLRFPEHVYCWFDSDDDRWALYHDLKHAKDSNAECWLIYNLLDDMQGEDFFSFLVHAVGKIQKQMGTDWELLFGEVQVFSDGNAQSKTRLEEALERSRSCLDDDQVSAANIWLQIEACSDIISELFDSYQMSAERKASVDEMIIATSIEDSLVQGSETVSSSRDEPATADLFTFIQMIMKTYLSLRKKLLTLIRLKFETASKDVDALHVGGNPCDQEDLHVVNVPQLHSILKTIWPKLTWKEIAQIYREAYDAMYPPSQWTKPAPSGISFHGFLAAAERLCLFSRYGIKIDMMIA